MTAPEKIMEIDHNLERYKDPSVVPGNAGSRVELFRGSAGLDALAADWRTLFAALPKPGLTQLWEWFRAYLDTTAAVPDDIYFGALYDGDGILAILPLEFKVKKVFGVLRMHVARLARPDFHQCDILVHPRTLQQFDLVATLEAFRARARRPWDMTRLGPTLEHSTASAVFQKAATQAIPPKTLSTVERGADTLEMGEGPYEVLLERMSKNFRGGLRKSRNKLAKLEDVTVEWARSPEALETAFPRFLEIEASGWKGVAGSGGAIALRAPYRAFYCGLMRSLAASGRCRINLMYHGKRVIAGQFGIVLGERYYLLKIGYDESYRQEAPGNMLLERLLQEAASDPAIRHVDLISDAAWHDSWKATRYRVLVHNIFHGSPLAMVEWARLRSNEVLRPLVNNLRKSS
jgi:CelD/BcsL family acetyltransferase involved in cellulose biosynthesis